MKNLAALFLFALIFVACSSDDDNQNTSCIKPTNIAIDQLASTSLLFTWDANDETSWELEYGQNGFSIGNGTVVQTSQTNYFIENLIPATAYQVFVRANCGSNGFSDYSQLDFVTEQEVAVCKQPIDLYQIAITNTSLQFGWNGVGETAWEIEYGVSPYTVGSGTPIPTSSDSYLVEGLTPATTYEIYVRANCGSDGYSEYSDAIVLTTAQ